jgi:hypothetical protein
MAIYLVDYENVYIDGLTGMEQLTEEDTLHIFYTHNSCGLTFGLYEQLIACKAAVKLNEVAVSPRNGDPVKNALDLQLMLYTGYLMASGAAQELYIISKDKDFLLGLDFCTQYLPENTVQLELASSIAAALAEPVPEETEEEPVQEQGHTGYEAFVRSLQEADMPSFAAICDQYAKPLPEEKPAAMSVPLLTGLTAQSVQEESPLFTVQYHNTVRNLLGRNTDEETVSRVCEMISASDDLVAFNNALARYYKDGQRTKQIYHKFKPKFEDLRHLSKARSPRR